MSNIISPDQPSCTVTLWAEFHHSLYAFGETRTVVQATPDPGWFADPQALLDPWKLSRGGEVAPDGDSISDMYIMQVYIPFSVIPGIDNPMPLWSATWSTDDFSPRIIRLDTLSESYKIYRDDGELLEFFGTDFAEGSGVIQVVPAPSAGALLASTIAIASRRRRRITPAARSCT